MGYYQVTNVNMRCRDIASGKNGMDLMFNLLTSTSSKWIHSPELRSALKAPLMRLCARYWNAGNKLWEIKQSHVRNDFFERSY